MTHFEQASTDSSRMQTALGFLIIVLICALSFGPLMSSGRVTEEGDTGTTAEAARTPDTAMRWVVDPEHPGKVKVAAPRSESAVRSDSDRQGR